MLYYCVTRETQLRQLLCAGFQPLLCLDRRGRTLTPVMSVVRRFTTSHDAI